jgi:cephalosporin-C deacetylase
MAYTDLPIEELRSYTPDLAVPSDLAQFWANTLAETRSWAIDARFKAVQTGLVLVDTFDVTFRGFGGSPIRAWLQIPSGLEGALPAVVEFVGYGGGRGTPHDHLLWASAGFAHLVMDTRGQGSHWSPGDTADTGSSGAPHADGAMTDGIQDPTTFYYRRVIADAVRAVEAVRANPRVDPDRVAVCGMSQGGGLSLATASLVPNVAGVMADVPFLSDYPRAIRISTTDPYLQVVRYLRVHRGSVAEVERTLSYFDVAILGRLATAPALFSVALMDEVCPPSTVYAAYNHYGGPKEIVEYPFNNHEGGEQAQNAARIHWLQGLLS